MIRAPMGDKAYWDGRVEKFQEALNYGLASLEEPSKNPTFAPQFWFDQSKYSSRMILLHYSRGDAIRDLGQPFPGLLDA